MSNPQRLESAQADALDRRDQQSDPVQIGDRFVALFRPVLDRHWCELTCTQCGQVTHFATPTSERMDWFTGCHRCGPLGSRWQEGPLPQDGVQHLHAELLVWFADVIESEPVSTYAADDPAFVAGQRVANVMEEKLMAASTLRSSATPDPVPSPATVAQEVPQYVTVADVIERRLLDMHPTATGVQWVDVEQCLAHATHAPFSRLPGQAGDDGIERGRVLFGRPAVCVDCPAPVASNAGGSS